MRVTCTHCQETFVIGEDALVVTDEDKSRSLSEAGAAVVFIGRPTRKPDLVKHWTRPTTASELDEEKRRAAEIQAAIGRGEHRQWWCGKCYNETPNPYPEK